VEVIVDATVTLTMIAKKVDMAVVVEVIMDAIMATTETEKIGHSVTAMDHVKIVAEIEAVIMNVRGKLARACLACHLKVRNF
jgi:hypothetical protein